MKNIKSQSVKFFSFSGFFKIVRLGNLIIMGVSQYFTAIFLVGRNQPWEQYLFDQNLLLLTISTMAVAAAGYLINDYYDVKIDYINKPTRVVVDRLLERRAVMFFHIFLNLFGIVMALLIGWKIALAVLFAALSLWVYSNQLKRLPFFGNLLVSSLTGVAIWIVGFFYQQNQLLVLIYAIFSFSFNLIREVIKDMEDIRGDANFGLRTLPIIWGIRKTKVLLYLLILSFIGILIVFVKIVDIFALSVFFLVILTAVLYFTYRLYKADRKRHFSFLSNYAKMIMLCGLLSMTFI